MSDRPLGAGFLVHCPGPEIPCSDRALGRSARELTLSEAALLAAILLNPIRRSAARPRPLLLRLSALYEARALRSPQVDACVRARRGR